MRSESVSTHTHTHARGPARDRTVDLVKTLAIFSVLVIHVSAGPLQGTPVGSGEWLAALFWGSVSRAAVPLFLMASGALLLDCRRPLGLRKLYTKNFLRLLTALFFWAACYKVFYLALWGRLSARTLLQAGKEVLLFQHEDHLYYLHIMLLVYAWLPITRLAAKHACRRQRAYLLGLWWLLGIFWPTMKGFPPLSLLDGIPTQWPLNMTYAAIGYTLLGRFLTEPSVPVRPWVWGTAALGGLGLTLGGTWACSLAAGALDTRFLEGMSVGVCLLAAGGYGLCRSLAVPPRLWKMLEYISHASFCVFLVHIFFLKIFAYFGLTARSGPVWLMVPLLSALLLGCGCAVYGVLSRIPGARRFLV